tara:strand:+ start:186 stop:383 length:198 start_codon:yes stop_codon:yes gene_type:complete
MKARNDLSQKTTLVRIDSSIYTNLQDFLRGIVPFKSASSYIGELIVKDLNLESQNSADEYKEDKP